MRNKNFIDLYSRELEYLRKTGTLFSKEYSGIAGNLATISGDAVCSDPFVERLLEGFAFMSARVQHKLESDYSFFSQAILEMVNPYILRPLPASLIVKINPDYSSDGLNDGFTLPRNVELSSGYVNNSGTRCQFRTTDSVVLWPFDITKASYHSRDLNCLDLPDFVRAGNVNSAVGIRLKMQADVSFDKTGLDSLSLYISGEQKTAIRILQAMLCDCAGVLVRPAGSPGGKESFIPAEKLKAPNFENKGHLLPHDSRVFSGYRMLQEYFMLPEKFLFVELSEISEAVAACQTDEIEVVFLFGSREALADNSVDVNTFMLYCVPAVNLFPQRTGRLPVNNGESRVRVVVDKIKPLDFEVYDIRSVKGYCASSSDPVFFDRYSHARASAVSGEKRYFSLVREKERFPFKRKNAPLHPRYYGSEVYLYLADSAKPPFDSDLSQLSVECLCTNRDLPYYLSRDKGRLEFETSVACPRKNIVSASRLSPPYDCPDDGAVNWKAVNFLSTNYLSFHDTAKKTGAGLNAADSVKEMLELYSATCGGALQRHVEGVEAVNLTETLRRFIIERKPVHLKGIDVEISFDEDRFVGSSSFLLGLVLNYFFSNYVTINSFVQTSIKNRKTGDVVRCPMCKGYKKLI